MDTIKTTLIRAPLPHTILRALKYLAIDTGLSVQALLTEAAILLLRYHGRAHGLPAPMASRPPGDPTAVQDKPSRKGGKSS